MAKTCGSCIINANLNKTPTTNQSSKDRSAHTLKQNWLGTTLKNSPACRLFGHKTPLSLIFTILFFFFQHLLFTFYFFRRAQATSPESKIGFDEFGDPYQSEPIEVDGEPLIFDHDDELTRTVGPHMAEAIKQVRLEKDRPPLGDFDPIEGELRVADYFTAEAGSTEDFVGDLCAMAGFSHDRVTKH